MCYHAVGLYVRSLQSNGYTVQEDKQKDDMVKHLMAYDPLTPQPEPEEKRQKQISWDLNAPTTLGGKSDHRILSHVYK